MLTQEDLQAIEALFIAERQQTKKIVREEARAVVKEELSLNNKVMGTIIRVELSEAKKEIVKAMTSVLREIVTHVKKQDNTLDDHEARITQLEEDNKFLPH